MPEVLKLDRFLLPSPFCLRRPAFYSPFVRRVLSLAAAKMIRISLTVSLMHWYACHVTALPTNATLLLPTPRVTTSPLPNSLDPELGLSGNIYARYFLHALAVVLIAFLMRSLYQYVKIHYFPAMPILSNGSSHFWYIFSTRFISVM